MIISKVKSYQKPITYAVGPIMVYWPCSSLEALLNTKHESRARCVSPSAPFCVCLPIVALSPFRSARPEDGDDEHAALQIPEMGSFLLLSLPTFAD